MLDHYVNEKVEFFCSFCKSKIVGEITRRQLTRGCASQCCYMVHERHNGVCNDCGRDYMSNVGREISEEEWKEYEKQYNNEGGVK